ncbi:hypothetical protein [Legionella cardiaca]|uniref:Secreted protein n=1 Tax=Legionella cardiaca TaxID=1071983 RepID=A0ABY8AUW5_9GAMM|nr:hypothetical protein [Legionella cardiaca]WED44480.1 hypothetical protein PXX05_06760 [Legionella cardiaca]
MNNYSVKEFKLLPILTAFFLIFIAIGYTTTAQAATVQPSTVSKNFQPTQLAYFYVYDTYPGRYWGPWRHYHRPRAYWTGWNTIYLGHRTICQRNCLVNTWNGMVIRCVKRCI